MQHSKVRKGKLWCLLKGCGFLPMFFGLRSILIFSVPLCLLHHDLHPVPLGKQLADLQKGFVLGLRDDHPDVDQRDETDHPKDEEAELAQSLLHNSHATEGKGGTSLSFILTLTLPIGESLNNPIRGFSFLTSKGKGNERLYHSLTSSLIRLRLIREAVMYLIAFPSY